MATENPKQQKARSGRNNKDKHRIVAVPLNSIDILQTDFLGWRSKIHPRSQIVPLFTQAGAQALQICRPLTICKSDENNRFLLVTGIRTLQALRECFPCKARVKAIIISRPSIAEHQKLQFLDYCLEQINDASSDHDLTLIAKSIIDCDQLYSITKELTGIRNKNELHALFGMAKSTFHRLINKFQSSEKTKIDKPCEPEEAVNLGILEEIR